jgi:hypothetical protein
MATLNNTFQPSTSSPLQKRTRMILLFWSLIVIGFFIILAVLWYGRLPVGKVIVGEVIHQPIAGAARAVIELQVGADHLYLNSTQGDNLIEGSVETLKGIETLETSVTPGSTISYSITATRPLAVREPTRWPEWRLNLTNTIPIDLTVRGGMCESKLDLSNLNIDNFNLTTDAGKYTVTFPRTGSVHAEVVGGLSHTQLLIPQDVAVRLEVIKEGQGHIDFNGRIYGQHELYESANYDTAPHHLDLTVTSGSSHVYIETVP